MHRIIIFFLLLFVKDATVAHDAVTIFNKVQLSAQAEAAVPNDELRILLAVEQEHRDAAKLAHEINQIMDWALSKAKSSESFQVRAIGYNISPVYDKTTVIAWRGIQQLELKGSAINKIVELVGQLQDKLQIKALHFSPAAVTRKKYQDELIKQAMEIFTQRMQLLKEQLDMQNVRIIYLDIDTGGSYPQQPIYPAVRMQMDKKISVVPAVEAGTSNMIVTINGSVQYY